MKRTKHCKKQREQAQKQEAAVLPGKSPVTEERFLGEEFQVIKTGTTRAKQREDPDKSGWVSEKEPHLRKQGKEKKYIYIYNHFLKKEEGGLEWCGQKSYPDPPLTLKSSGKRIIK